MINTRFIESEIKKAESALTKTQTRIAELKQLHARGKTDVLHATHEVDVILARKRRLEEKEREDEIKVTELKRKLMQIEEDKRRTERTLENETNISQAAEKRLALANRTFDDTTTELQTLTREEQTFKQKVTELQRSLKKLEETVRHSP